MFHEARPVPKEKVEDSVDLHGLRIASAHKFAQLKEVLLYLSIEGHCRFLMPSQSDKGAGDTSCFKPYGLFEGGEHGLVRGRQQLGVACVAEGHLAA